MRPRRRGTNQGRPKGDGSVRLRPSSRRRRTRHATAHTAGYNGILVCMYSCDYFLQILDTHSGSAHMEQDRDPTDDPRRPAVVPDPRSGSLDLGSRNQPWTPFPATMNMLSKDYKSRCCRKVLRLHNHIWDPPIFSCLVDVREELMNM
jgi:hypothetical protein